MSAWRGPGQEAFVHFYFVPIDIDRGMSSTMLPEVNDNLTNFYRCTIESILSGCITAWYGCCPVQDRKKLKEVMNVAQSITQTSLPSIDSVYTSRCLRKSSQHNQGTHTLRTFSLPPSSVGKKIQKSEVTYQPTQEQLLPCCCQTFEWTYLALS